MKNLKTKKSSVKKVSKIVLDSLSKQYGMFYFDDNFIEEVRETVEWYYLDTLNPYSTEQLRQLSVSSISHLVEKYDLKKIDNIW